MLHHRDGLLPKPAENARLMKTENSNQDGESRGTGPITPGTGKNTPDKNSAPLLVKKPNEGHCPLKIGTGPLADQERENTTAGRQ